MRFASREDAGRRLGQRLLEQGVVADLVLGLPRGGVVVAAAVARSLHRPLDVLVVRKIGHPAHREFAVGALAEPDVLIYDEASLMEFPADRAELDRIVEDERVRLREYQRRFHPGASPRLEGKSVMLVDDGLATGATAEAAALSAKQQGARRVIVAAPVASTSALERLKKTADNVVVLLADPAFGAVGRYYHEFPQTDDEEVIALLRGEVSSQ